MKNMKLTKTYKKIALGALVLGLSGAAVLAYQNSGDDPSRSVTLDQIPAGSEVAFKVYANGQQVASGQTVLEEGKVFDLPAPDLEKIADNTSLKYDLDVKTPNAAETLNMFMDLDVDTKSLSVKGDGLQAFSELTVTRDGQAESSAADWSGMFTEDMLQNESLAAAQTVLAFQNLGIDADVAPMSAMRVQIFGDSSGSNLGAVQSRYTSALIRMAEELSAVMVKQTQIIGMFFDASIQLDTQRKQQELQARAHKDYHPSEQMCRVGTFVRSVAHTESRAESNKHALNAILMAEYLGVTGSSSSFGYRVSTEQRISNYANKYCDPHDNNSAVSVFCNTTWAEIGRRNVDIDYTRLIDTPLTLDVDFLTTTGTESGNTNEADIVAMARNLYFPQDFENSPDLHELLEKDTRPHFDSRSFAAKLNVAHSSFLNIIGMKSRAPEGQATTATDTTPTPAPFGSDSQIEHGGGAQTPRLTTRDTPNVLTEDSGWAYMKAMMREFGLADDEIDQYMGERPSYYAQMEILTKKMYQNSQFYTNLYDKPTNVKRIGTSMDAIALMHQRDRYESMLRQEMLTALLLEEALAEPSENANSGMYSEMQNSQN